MMQEQVLEAYTLILDNKFMNMQIKKMLNYLGFNLMNLQAF